MSTTGSRGARPKVSKVTAKKRTTAKKVTAKKVARKRSTKKKSDTIQLGSAAAKGKSVKPGSNKKSLSTTSGRLATSTSLLVLSPFRFPLDVDTIAIQTARFGGAFFVLIGAFFTLMLSGHLFTDLSANSLMAATYGSMDCKIDANLPSGTISGTVPINAEKTGFGVDYINSYEYKGPNDSTWKTVNFSGVDGSTYTATNYSAQWNTSSLVDGSYQTAIRFYCNNASKFHYGPTVTLSNGNAPAQTETQTSTGGGSMTTDTTMQTATRIQNSTQTFNVNPNNPINGTNVRLRVTFDTKPNSAKLSAKNISTGAVTDLGTISSLSSNTWDKYFDSTKLNDGTYIFQVIAKYPDPVFSILRYDVTITDTANRTIENYVAPVETDTTDTADTTSESPETSATDDSADDVADTVTDTVVATETTVNLNPSYIRTFSSNVLSGTQSVRVVAEAAQKVELNLRRIGTNQDVFLGYAFQHSDTEWRYSLDTTQLDDGDYVIKAMVIRSNVVSEVLQYAVSFNNDLTELEDPKLAVDPLAPEQSIDTYTDQVITVSVIGSQPLRNTATVNVDVTEANYVELYALPQNSATQKYIGKAQKVDADTWSFKYNTINSPNGSYYIVANLQTPYGFFSKRSNLVAIYNEIVTVSEPEDIKYAETVKQVSSEVSVDTSVTFNVSDPDELQREYEALIEEYEEDIEKLLQVLASAYRSKNQATIDAAKERINRLVAEIKQSVLRRGKKEELITLIDERIQALTKRIADDVARIDVIIAERTQSDVSLDTDGDGITDYDEITIYGTDPKVADSDGDGIPDGVEILNGFDPTDSTPEAAVQFESPKEIGVVREDILAVDSIITEDFGPTDTTVSESDARPVAIITGRALPNSFATLYIFSTPIVVTVRTEADGSWQYRFDKELEDGQHQVYVGITDNAGKIVAKSNPFNFVKEAQAFSQVDAPAPGATIADSAADTSANSTFMMLLVAAISVVSIGLVLILIGLHLNNRPKLTFTESPAKPVS